MANNCLSVDWNSDPIILGTYIQCAIPKLFGALQMILIAAVIIMIMWLIRKTVMNTNNSQVLQELPKQWIFTLLLALFAIGAGGTLLNIFIKFLGFGSIATWLEPLNNLLRKL